LSSKYTDERLDIALGRLLQTGVILAAAVVLAGGIVYLIRHGGSRPEYRSFISEPKTYRDISAMLRAGFNGSGRAIIQLGLLLLIATPVARVAWSVYAFFRERDNVYVVATVIVLSLLMFSIFAGHS